MATYTIPVAFHAQGEDELAAAKKLVSILSSLDIMNYSPAIECWWTPNHPVADKSDNEAILAWLPHERSAALMDDQLQVTAQLAAFYERHPEYRS